MNSYSSAFGNKGTYILYYRMYFVKTFPVLLNHTFFNFRNQKLVYFDYGFTCIFAIEVSLKLIDYGVILHPGSCLRELWNIMDLLVVSCAITSFSMDML